MIKYRGLILLLSTFAYILIFSYFMQSYVIKAEEVKENIEEIQEDQKNMFEELDTIQEDQEEDAEILSDTIDYISEDEKDYSDRDYVQENQQDIEEETLKDIIAPIKSGSRSMINTYDANRLWLFNPSYYRTEITLTFLDTSNNSYNKKVYIFQYNKLPDYDLITEFVNNYSYFKLADFPDLQLYVVYNSSDNDVEFTINSRSLHDAVENYINNYGYPDSNCYWEAPTPTGEPEPTVTPTPETTPIPEPVPIEIDNSVFVMIIFALGLIGGILSGNVLTGFIK